MKIPSSCSELFTYINIPPPSLSLLSIYRRCSDTALSLPLLPFSPSSDKPPVKQIAMRHTRPQSQNGFFPGRKFEIFLVALISGFLWAASRILQTRSLRKSTERAEMAHARAVHPSPGGETILASSCQQTRPRL